MKTYKVFKTIYRALNILVILMMTLNAPLSVFAYTYTDKEDYQPGETVTIFGDNTDGIGYLPGETVHVDVYGPPDYDVFLMCDAVADENGAWSCQVVLPADETAIGLYYYITYGLTSGVSEMGNFTDGAIGTYDQCSNDDGDGYATGNTGCRWINGNLQRNNSTYYEGDATIQRAWLTQYEPGSEHTVTFKYGTTKGAKHAYDYLTTWDYSESWSTVQDRCEGIRGCEAAPETPSPAIPQDPNAKGLDDFVRKFTIRGGTITAVSIPQLVSGVYGTGDTETIVTVSFTVGAADGTMCTTKSGVTTCDVAIWFGAHVALTSEWMPIDGQTGASGISGSPYHVSLDAIDGEAIGQRDNQMQSDAVRQLGTIIIIKDAVPNDPQDFGFVLDGLNNMVYENFSLDDDDDATLSNTFTIEVSAGLYDVTEEAVPGWTLTNILCVDDSGGTVTSVPDAKASLDLAEGETVTCTFTNMIGKGRIVVEKQTDPDGSTQSFEFDPSWGENFFLTDGGRNDSGELMPGLYSVAEVNLPVGWSLSSATCSDGSSPSAIYLDPFETVTCIFNDFRAAQDLIVTKTAVPHFTRTYHWTIDKIAEEPTTKYGIADASVPFMYDVSVEHDAGVDSGWYLEGVITINNPNDWEAITLTSLTDSAGGVTCDVDPLGTITTPYVVPAIGSLEVPYRCDMASGAAGTNTATATWDAELYNTPSGLDSGDATFEFITPDTVVDESIDVSDSEYGDLGTVSVVDENPTTFQYQLSWPAEGGTCKDYQNIASFVTNDTLTQGSNDAWVEVCAPLDLLVTKTAVPTFTRTWDWTITKDWDKIYNLNAGESVTHGYKVSVNPSSTDSDWMLTGVITITNPNLIEPFTVTISDAVNNGGSCNVDQSSVTVPVDGSVDVNYTCTWAEIPTSYRGTNTVTITWDKVAYHTPTGTASYDKAFEFTNPTEVDPVITVDDNNLEDETWSADRASGLWNYTEDFTCSANPADYTDGFYSYQVKNTAKINETGDWDDATVTVNCFAPVVTKTVETYWNRDWDWTITKDFDGTYNLFAGETVTHNYEVSVDPTYTDNYWGVKGSIVVTNNNPDVDMLLTSVADLAGGIKAIVDCGQNLTVPADGTLTCTYDTGTQDSPNLNPFEATNTATVVFAEGSWTGSEAIVFSDSPTTEDEPTIDVSDTNGMSWKADRTSAKWTYTKDFSCSTDANYVNGVYSYTHDNTATISQTGQNDSASVTVNCYAPVVSKTAETYWNRAWDWTITKDYDGDYNLFAGESVTHNYKVSVDPTYVDNFWGVKGQITVHNPHPSMAMTLTSLTDNAGGIPADVTCTSLVVPAASDLMCTYDTGAQDSEDLNPFGSTNTATALFAGVNWTGSAAIAFSATPTTEDDPVITVDDDNLTGEIWSANRASAEWTYTKDFSCPTDVSGYTGGVLALNDHVNTATIVETGETDIATVGVTCYAPVLSKTALGDYDERHEWTIEKTVTPDTQNAFVGDTVGYEWKVVVTEETFEENFSVHGAITVVNPSTNEMVVKLSDMLGDGTVPVISASATCDFATGVLTIPAGETATCNYTADLLYDSIDNAPTTNTGTVVINDVTVTTTVDIDWDVNIIRGSATVTDDQIGLNQIITDGGTFTGSEQYTCSTDTSLYEGDGFYSFSEENLAIVTSGGSEEDRDTATETINCYAPVISKTAAGAYDERHEWDVEKTVNPTSQSGFAGDTVPFTWTVTVVESVFEESFVASGTITVVNPNPEDAMTVTLSDVLSDLTVATITACTGDADLSDGLTIAAGGSSVCNYTAVLSYDALSKAPTNNTATAMLNGVDFSASDPIEWAANVIRGEALLEDVQGPLSETITGSGTWTIVDSYTCSIDKTKYTTNYSYTETISNTATVTSEEEEQDSSTISTAIDCYIPEISKTAAGAYDERHEWDVEKTVDPTSQSGFAGETVPFTWTVTVTESVFEENFVASGTITVVNHNPEDAMTVMLSDVLSDSTVATITACTGDADLSDGLTIAAGGTSICDYTATLSSELDDVNEAPTNNTATAMLNGVPFSASDPIEWTAKVIRGEALLEDVQGPLSETISGSDTWTVKDSYTCSAVKTDYTENYSYTETVWNTATVTSEDVEQDSSTAHTIIDCYIPEISKTAAGAYDERHEWDVEKTVDPALQSGFAGETVPFTWTITVVESVFEENFVASGTITVVNHNPEDAMTVTLSDVLSDMTVATITACTGDADLSDGLTIAAGGTSVCNYTAVLSYDALSKAPTNNTATAMLNGVDFSASDPIEWAANVIRGSVTLDDDQNPAWPVTITDGGTWTYPDNYTCSIETGLYEGDGTYSFTDDNLATVKFGDTVLDEDSASSVVNCYNPSVSKTAVGGYVRTYKWLIDKSVDKGVEEPVTVFVGEAVDFNYTVKVTPNGYTDHDYVVTGEITVVNPHPTEAITVDVTDEVNIETVTCTVVDGVDAIVPANSSKVFTYSCVGDDLPMVTENSVFANWTAYSGEDTVIGSASATVDVIFPETPASEEFKTVEVYDDKTIITDPPSGELLGTVTWNADGKPTPFTYTLTKVAPFGCATYTNTAWIEETDQSDSVTIEICGEYWAFTPGFWKNHTSDTGNGHDAWKYTNYSTGMLLGDTFNLGVISAISPRGAPDLKTFASLTLLEALRLKGGAGLSGAGEILMRAAVASLLNASFHEKMHGGTTVDGWVYFPYTSAKVIERVEAVLAVGDISAMLELAAELDGYNNGIHYIDWNWNPGELLPTPPVFP